MGLTFALALGISTSWLFVGSWIKETKNKTKSIILFIATALLVSLVSLALSFIAIWPPYDLLTVSLSIIVFIVLVIIGVFIVTTYPGKLLDQ